jgi:hypothetical protein
MGTMKLGFIACVVLTAALAACASANAPPAAPLIAANYDIAGTIDQKTGEIAADVTITLRPEDIHDGSSFFLGDWYTIDRLAIDGGITTTQNSADKPIAHLREIVLHLAHPLDKPVTLHLAYHGLLNGPDPDKGDEVFTPGRMELRLEGMWIPVRSDFAMRFTTHARIAGIPQDEVVVSQGQYTHDGDVLTLDRTYPDFDLPVVAARGLQRFATPNVEVYADDLDSRLVKLLCKHAVGAIDYYQPWFGPIPGGPPVRVVVTSRSGSAYARRSFISVGASREEIAKNPNYPDDGPAALVAHEFAHAWWSPANPLTDNYWLAESMAEYSSLRYIQHAFGDKVFQGRLEKKRIAAKGAPPILGHGRPTKIDLYQKGPLLLFQLEADIGREKMDKVLAILGRNPPHTTEDFLKVLSDVAGAPAAEHFHQMLAS